MLKQPSGRQRVDVGPVDLVHLGIAATREVQVVQPPVHVLGQRGRRERHRDGDDPEANSHSPVRHLRHWSCLSS